MNLSFLLLSTILTTSTARENDELAISELFSRVSELESLLKQNEKKIDNKLSFMDETRAPIGTIIPWMGPDWMELPSGWQRCNGAEILSGELRGSFTPDLNNLGLFLRGGSDSDIGSIQEASLQEHTHKDDGHSHEDRGHVHTEAGHWHYHDGEMEAGLHKSIFVYRTPAMTEASEDTDSDRQPRSQNCYSENTLISDVENWHLRFCVDQIQTTATSNSKIESSRADIGQANSGLSGVEGANAAEETRPANMRVSYIV